MQTFIAIEPKLIGFLFAIVALAFSIATTNARFKNDTCWPYGLATCYIVIFAIASIVFLNF
jgi:hypothetical protein